MASSATTGTSPFAPVALSRSQAVQLEKMMKQQVQDAIRAHSAQHVGGEALDPAWRSVGSVGHLKTCRLRGADAFSSSSSWVSTIEGNARTASTHLHERATTGNTRGGSNTWSRSSRASRFAARSRRTEGSTAGNRDLLGNRPPLHSYRTFGRVQGHYRDIVDVHYAANSADFLQQQKLLLPGAVDGAVLRTIRATKDSYLGIKWLAESPFGRKRDACFLEMVGYTINNSGQEIGFVTIASVDVPECPAFSASMKITRVHMKRTMLVMPTEENPKVTSELFIMGATEATDSSMVANAHHRLSMTVLNDISLVIDSQNIAKQTLILQGNWVPDDSRPACTICSRRFNFMYRRRHHCRLCGDVICKTCYVMRSVPSADIDTGRGVSTASAIGQTKFCVRCVMGLRAIDKRLDNFSQQVSKMLSINISNTGMSVTDFEADSQRHSPTSTLRGSSDEASDEANAASSSGLVAGGVGAMIARSEMGRLGSAASKAMRRSLSVDPANSNSYGKLQRLSQLSRHSSAASLGDSQHNPVAEEKMQISFVTLRRTVAI
ncbi:hypothetical protein BBJ28_00003674 [Nothophytophthora sp. Chile5]|nr:hypothetical protein BBJ28_00003674 [Nothophytophthora sp. Chile5]